MAAVERLADELLEMILADLLYVSDAEFHRQSTDLTPVLDPNFWPASTILLVCGTWSRVATPLLYKTVVLRSAAQAEALEDAFKHNRELAQHVRRFRVEGSWRSLEPIMETIKEIHVFYMVLNVYPTDNVAALRCGLAHIRPQEVVLCDVYGLETPNLRRVLAAVAGAIPQWTTLVTFYMPDVAPAMEVGTSLIADALSIYTGLRHIYADDPHRIWPRDWASLRNTPNVLFHFHTQPWSARVDLEQIDLPAELRDRIHISKYPGGEPAPTEVLVPRGPISIVPLFAQPAEVKRRILSIIFSYVVMPKNEDDPEYIADNYDRCSLNRMRRNLSLVSRDFHLIMRPIMYGTPLFETKGGFFRFVRVVLRNPSRGGLVRHLALYFAAGLDENVDKALCNVLPKLHALQTFVATNPVISVRAFDKLAHSAGRSLVKLSIRAMDAPEGMAASPAVWEEFPSLRHLQVAGLPNFGHSKAAIPLFCLRSVHTLYFDLTRPETGRFFTPMLLPRLTTLVIVASTSVSSKNSALVASFIKAHGLDLVSLTLPGFNDPRCYLDCPNLRTLSLTSPKGLLRNHLFQRFTAHGRLEEIELHEYVEEQTARGRKKVSRFFKDVDLRGFSRLTRLIFPNYNWPCDAREIEVAVMPHYAEVLKREYNVDIVGGNGRTWRQRLPRRR